MSLLDLNDVYYLQKLGDYPDGFGGIEQRWGDDKKYYGKKHLNSSTVALVGGAIGLNALFTIVIDGRDVELKLGYILREEKSNQYYEVQANTQDEASHPELSFNRVQATIKRVVNPNTNAY